MEKCKITTHDPVKERDVLAGYLSNGVFHKVCEANHYMKKEKGYGIQEDVIIKLYVKNCRIVRLHLPKNKGTKDIPFNLYWEAQSKYYGHGKQRFVKLATSYKKELF